MLPPFSCLGELQGSPFLNRLNLVLKLTRLSPPAKVGKVDRVEKVSVIIRQGSAKVERVGGVKVIT